MSGINTGILHNAQPLTTTRIAELEKEVLESQQTFAYLDESSDLCFALPFSPEVIKDLAWNNAYALSIEGNRMIKRAYKKSSLNTFYLNEAFIKSSFTDEWQSTNESLSTSALDFAVLNQMKLI